VPRLSSAEGFDGPVECGMYNEECEDMLGGWTVGSAGECQTSDRGFLVGKGHYTYIIVEQHWNNPLLVADY